MTDLGSIYPLPWGRTSWVRQDRIYENFYADSPLEALRSRPAPRAVRAR